MKKIPKAPKAEIIGALSVKKSIPKAPPTAKVNMHVSSEPTLQKSARPNKLTPGKIAAPAAQANIMKPRKSAKHSSDGEAW